MCYAKIIIFVSSCGASSRLNDVLAIIYTIFFPYVIIYLYDQLQKMRQVPSGVVIGRGMYALLIVAAHDITIGIGFRNALSHRTAQIYHFRVRARTILQVSSLPQLIPRRVWL